MSARRRLRRPAAWALAVGLAFLAAGPAQAAPQHRAPRAQWQTVLRLASTASANSPPFVVTGPWRLVWSVRKPAGGGALWIRAGRFSGGVSPAFLVKARSATRGATAVQRGTGTYYLHVQTDEPYAVAVQTYAPKVAPQPHYRWKTVTVISGTGALDSSLFTVKRPWRLVWTGPKPGTITVNVTIPGLQNVADRFGDVLLARGGIGYEYTAGSYYLVITGMSGYRVAVQQGS